MPASRAAAIATRVVPPTRRGIAGPLLQRLGQLHGWRADLSAALAGAVSAAALPPVYAVPVLLVCIPALLTLITAAPRPLVAVRRGFFFGFGLHLIGLYWITEAILYEAARFWWLVPLAVPALAAVLAVFIAIPAGIARLFRPGCVDSAGPCRRLGSVGSRTPVRRNRISMEPARQCLGVSRLPWRCDDPAGLAGRRAWPDRRHAVAGGNAFAQLAMADRRHGAVGGMVRLWHLATRPAGSARPGPEGSADPGERGAGPEMGP